MYDALRGIFRLPCPARGEVAVRLSSFRAIERLPGPAHPAVYRVDFACACGREHSGLVTHGELDWAPLVGSDDEFFNVMTGRLEPVSAELSENAALRIRRGEWPWSFFCVGEERVRQVFPSAFCLLSPRGGGVGARCPSCAVMSLNFCTHAHVDVPFYHDASVGVVEQAFPGEGVGVAELSAELSRERYPTGWRQLAA